jgi:transcriptional regulator with XRE-family HTH domain
MNTTRSPSKRLGISEKDITALLEGAKLSRKELASLLNVNPASLSRWADPKNPQAPTSTTYLVLIPLMLAAGIEILPAPDPAVVQKHLGTFKGLGLLKEEELKSERVRRSLHRAIAVLDSEEVAASRRLFNALQEA